MLIFWSLVRNSVVLAVYLLFSVACFLTVHEHSFTAERKKNINYDIISYNYYKTHNPPPQKHSVTGVVLYAKTVRKPYFKRFLGIEKVHRNFDRNHARG